MDFGYSGELRDPSGLIYYGYRYYSPELGRWINRDPIGEDGGMNLYELVGSDAVNHYDILGLYPPKTKVCLTYIYIGHCASTGNIKLPDNRAPMGKGDRSLFVTCKRKSVNDSFKSDKPQNFVPDTGGDSFKNKNPGKPVPKKEVERDDGLLFPNPNYFKKHPMYDESRGDMLMTDAYRIELANAKRETKNQCKEGCDVIEIRVVALDNDGLLWMKDNQLGKGMVGSESTNAPEKTPQLVAQIYCKVCMVPRCFQWVVRV